MCGPPGRVQGNIVVVDLADLIDSTDLAGQASEISDAETGTMGMIETDPQDRVIPPIHGEGQTIGTEIIPEEMGTMLGTGPRKGLQNPAI
jgi:hypothetical protein